MITKWIRFTVVPERAAEFEREIGRVQAASRQEVGCAQYTAFRDVDDSAVFTVLESWDTAAAFDAHRESGHLAEFRVRCGEMIVDKAARSIRALA